MTVTSDERRTPERMQEGTDRQAVGGALAYALAYPGDGFEERLEEALAVIRRHAAEAAVPLAAFCDAVRPLTPEEREELYTRTFDINPVCSLEIGWQLFGEEYHRGALLVRLRSELRRHGIEESTELPDHLTHVLSLLDRMAPSEAQSFAACCVIPAVDKMLVAFEGTPNPYGDVLLANAPCENVCPVLATVHNAEGLNQQVYNRCVGTRYCANNCPYKVRRFNWFEYSRAGRLENAALNPDITVRSRGVMEKCSFCVQRIQDATRAARQRGESVADGAIRTACQQSCPAGAIVFGDLNDPQSAVAQAAAAGRSFQVLPELNVRPSVGYLRVVRNREA